MSQRRWSLAALAFAPILALGACDQLSDVWERMTGGAQVEGPGPTPLDDVPLEARALSGAVQPQAEVAAVLAPDPILIAPGQILVGAQVERELSDAATDMGLASNLARAVRTEGVEALEQMPDNVATQLRTRAETEASAVASNAAQDTLRRLGISGEIRVRPGGVVTVDLTSGVSPTAQRRNKQQTSEDGGENMPDSIEWSPSDRCPRIVSQAQMENDIGLATLCAIQRLTQSGQFEYVEPNYIADSGFTRPPRRDRPPAQQPPAQQPTTQNPAPTQPAPVGGVPNDPLYALQWHYRASTGANASPGGAGFVTFWEAQQVGARTVRVAVLDTGLDLSHPDMRNTPNTTTGVDLINNPERGGDGDGVDADANDAGDRCGATTAKS
jgi:serine protease